MMRVLFVDDDQMLLDALQNSFRRFRKEWEFEFAQSGEIALEIMARAACDVIISDMRMSKMDGAELLASIQDLYPSTTRIILTGQADRNSLIRALGVTHRFLGKPCEPEELRACLERVASVRKRLTHPRLRALVGNLNALPPVPTVYQEFLREIQQEGTSIARVADIVEKDPSIAAKVLQIANSTVFSSGRTTGSIRVAASMVGFDVLRALVLAASVFSSEKDESNTEWLARLQEHSLRVAMTAQLMLPEGKIRDAGYTAGLLHDIGYVVFRLAAQNDNKVPSNAENIEVLQEARWKISHAEVGAYLIGTWGLPMEIVEAVAYHEGFSADTASDLCTLSIYVAERVVEQLDANEPIANANLDWAGMEAAGVDATVKEWIQLVSKSSLVESVADHSSAA